MEKRLESVKIGSSNADFTRQNSPTSAANNDVQILLDVVQNLSLAKDIETIMFIIRKAARKLTNSDGATFILREGDQCFYADEDAIAPLWKGKRFEMSHCISGWVMEHRESVAIADIYSDPRIPVDAYRSTFVKSLAMVPIRTVSPVGAIGIYWAENYRPTNEQVHLLKALADSTSVAIENIQLHSALEQGDKKNSAQMEITSQLQATNRNLEDTLTELNHRNEEMHGLKELGSTLQTCLYIEEAYRLIAQYGGQLFPEVIGVLYAMHPSRNYLESMISWGGDALLEEKIIKPDECWGLRRGALYKVDDTQNHIVCSHCTATSVQPYTCIPLFAQSDIIGLLYMKQRDQPKEEQDYFKRKNNRELLAGMFAEQSALGISNIQLRETLRNQSLRDVLTNLYNRRYLEETLEREINRCSRKSLSLAVFMIDIDFFKHFNDQFGHEAGDIVMQSLANVMHDFARKSDIICRYGGEEFIFVMPEISIKEALQRAKDLHEAVSHIHLRYGGVALTQITISIGLAVYPKHGENMHNLIAASDLALYKAKNTGRNKTELYKKESGA